MIEQGIYFALGCFLTALVALLFAPVFWRRALRLTRQRLQLQIPLSMQEILAERDELRAEFAVERVRIEQDLADARAKADVLMAESGRRIVAADRLEEERNGLAAELDAHRTRIAALESEMASARDALARGEAAMQQVVQDRDGWRERTNAGIAQQERLNREIESQRTTIAGLETAKAGLELRLEDGARALAHEQETVRTLKSRLETAMMQATRHEGAGILLRRELDDAQGGRRQLEDELSNARAALRDIKREHEREIAALRELHADRDKINALLRRERDDVRVQLAKTENELAGVRAELMGRESKIREMEQQGLAEAEHRSVSAALRRELQESYGRARQLETQIAELASLQAERGRSQDEIARLGKEMASLREELDTARRQTAASPDADAGIDAALREELEAMRKKSEGLERNLRAVETTLTDMRERDRAANLARGLLAEKARRTERLLESQVKALTEENSQLRASLGGAGAARPAAADSDGGDQGDLRQTIHALGLAVADITRRMGPADDAPGAPNRRRKHGDSSRSVRAL